ncbi:MAG: hypothetical protein Q9201_007270 [Fulgogasparrea decipioides]
MGRVMDRILQMIAGSGTGFKKHRNASAASSSAHTRSNSDASLESCVTITGPTVTSTRPIKIPRRIYGDERFLYPNIDVRHDYGFVARGQKTKADVQERGPAHRLMLKESRERYEDLLAKQTYLCEEERMIDWALPATLLW